MFLYKLTLTPSGRPLLFPGEVEVVLMEATDLEFPSGAGGDAANPREKLTAGVLTLTTARILWTSTSAGAYFVPLPAMRHHEELSRGMFRTKSPRVRFEVFVTPDVHPAVQPTSATGHVVAAFRGRAGCDPLVASLPGILAQRAWTRLPPTVWLTSPPPTSSTTNGTNAVTTTTTNSSSHNRSTAQQPQPPSEETATFFRASDAGVAGILRRQERDSAAADRDLSEAFADLNALKEKASAMVSLASKLKAAVARSEGGADDKRATEDVHGWLLSLGIDSPVTKESAGALYHQQLSRQLADFLLVPPTGDKSSHGAPLTAAGGMLSLVDAWCIYNRARGTALVSPEDVRKACELWPKLGIPIVLRTFSSGSLAVVSGDFDDDVVDAKLLVLMASDDVESARSTRPLEEAIRLARRAGGLRSVGVTEAARVLGTSLELAREHLLCAESRGWLCRDDGGSGLRFSYNFFRDL